MYQKSKSSEPVNLFSNVLLHLNSSSTERLLNPNSWHQVFYEEVIARFPEDIFSVLYSSKMGRPNQSIRILVGMLILKEGHGWTDEQLFEEIHFNLQVRWALGLRNLDDSVPGSSTYYDFKKSLQKHQESSKEDLLEQAFEELTFKQIKKYRINGRHFRMDSKLYNSNIATSNLVRLLSGTLQLFLGNLSNDQRKLIAQKYAVLLEQLTGHSSDGIAYRQTKVEKEQFITDCGNLLNHLCIIFNEKTNTAYPLLVRLLSEQYEIVEIATIEEENSNDRSDGSDDCSSPQITLKDRQQINGSTLQSPHDAEAAYRKKENGGSVQEIQGYTTNIGETCHPDNAFNLITTLTTAPVTTQDNDFVKSSIEQSQKVGGTIEQTWMDGAYSSAENRNWLAKCMIIAYFPALAGYEGFHQFEWVEKNGDSKGKELIITDLRDGKKYTAQLTRNGKSYRITYEAPLKDGRKRYRYFKLQEIENYFVRREIENIPKEILDRRANIEATIHQVFCKLGKKSRYRGLFANHLMVLGRCFWVNCRRITQNRLKNAFLELIFSDFLSLYFTKHLIRIFSQTNNYPSRFYNVPNLIRLS